NDAGEAGPLRVLRLPRLRRARDPRLPRRSRRVLPRLVLLARVRRWARPLPAVVPLVEAPSGQARAGRPRSRRRAAGALAGPPRVVRLAALRRRRLRQLDPR